MDGDEDTSVVGNMVEIREFVDAGGAEISSEVVKLADETNGLKKGDMGQVDAIMEKLQENLNMGAGKGQEMDDDSRFVREVSLLSSAHSASGASSSGSDLSFLDDLEQKEEAAVKADKGHVFAGASSGWKKGFLGGGGSSKPTKKATAPPAVPRVAKEVVEDVLPKKAVSFSADTAVPSSPVAETVVTSSAPSGAKGSLSKSSDNEGVPVKRPTAFSGVVKERF